jgi:hypothetical protein
MSRLAGLIRASVTAPVADGRTLSIWACLHRHGSIRTPSWPRLHREGYQAFRDLIEQLVGECDAPNKERRRFSKQTRFCRHAIVHQRAARRDCGSRSPWAATTFSRVDVVRIALDSTWQHCSASTRLNLQGMNSMQYAAITERLADTGGAKWAIHQRCREMKRARRRHHRTDHRGTGPAAGPAALRSLPPAPCWRDAPDIPADAANRTCSKRLPPAMRPASAGRRCRQRAVLSGHPDRAVRHHDGA